MKFVRLTIISILVMSFFSATSLYAADLSKLEKRIDNCEEVMREVIQMPDKGIPTDLLSKCAGVAVFPYVIKGGFFVGARFGRGIVLAHDPKTNKWHPPAFFTVGGGSFGLQFGAQAIDLILVIMNKRGLEGLLQDKFTLGGDAAVAAGPLGRNASADTDLLLKAGIFSYSRTKGVFAGIALKGAVIMPDKDANHTYYDGAVKTEEILFGDKLIPPASSKELLETLRKASVKQ
ncbi:MAG: lipid-binding SYLF domain-containing protein [Candidatus Omnitrophica bacterium]|nr:lipid-binding SYLF domain-containing protein [Candidatus Omnitrophota bacterium]